jgi:hypothetical protein
MAAWRKDGEEGIELTLKKSRKWTWRRIDIDVRTENLKIPISDNERRLQRHEGNTDSSSQRIVSMNSDSERLQRQERSIKTST